MKVATHVVCIACLFFLQPLAASSQFIQQGSKLVGTGATGSSVFQGYSVALSADGNTAIVGGIGDNANAGAAWVYTRTGGIWAQNQRLFGTGATGSASQGFSVGLSADGTTAIVGGIGDNTNAGAAWVFIRVGGVWAQQGNKLVGTGAVGGAQQGCAVALSADGNTAIIGGFRDNAFGGAAWVFTRNGNVWSQQGNKLVATNAIGSARLGISVDLSADGNTAIVGGHTDNANAGAAWIYTRSGSSWTPQSKLIGSGAVGQARQGRSVSISSDGNTAIVGGYEDDASMGAVWVYTRSGGVWAQQGDKFRGTGAAGNASQGFSLSLSGDGNTALIGGIDDNAFAGAAWVFTQSGGVWTQQGNKLVGTGAVGNANQGGAVAISFDGNTAIVGGIADNANAGAAWVYIPGSTSVQQTSFETPEGFVLQQNYPNPFNPSTRIAFSVQGLRFTSLKVFDVLGREVATLVNEELKPGNYETTFSARGGSASGGEGNNLSSGVYFYRLQAGGFVQTKKLVLQR